MKRYSITAAFFCVFAIGAMIASTGCSNKNVEETIGAAPQTRPDAKAPSPPAVVPTPVGGGDSSSSAGGANSETAAK